MSEKSEEGSSSESEDKIVSFDEFAEDPEEAEDDSIEIPDSIEPAAKRVTKEELLEQIPNGLIYSLNVFCGRCSTLHTVHLNASTLEEDKINLIHAVQWEASLCVQEKDDAQVGIDGEVAVVEFDIVKSAAILRILAAVESYGKSCIAACVHSYLETMPGSLREKSRNVGAELLSNSHQHFSFLLSTSVVAFNSGETLNTVFLYVDENLIEEAKATVDRHLKRKV